MALGGDGIGVGSDGHWMSGGGTRPFHVDFNQDRRSGGEGRDGLETSGERVALGHTSGVRALASAESLPGLEPASTVQALHSFPVLRG